LGKIIPPDTAAFGFVNKAHLPVYIWDICRWMQQDGRKDKQDGGVLFFSTALTADKLAGLTVQYPTRERRITCEKREPHDGR
jgi:hypothetical protein